MMNALVPGDLTPEYPVVHRLRERPRVGAPLAPVQFPVPLGGHPRLVHQGAAPPERVAQHNLLGHAPEHRQRPARLRLANRVPLPRARRVLAVVPAHVHVRLRRVVLEPPGGGRRLALVRGEEPAQGGLASAQRRGPDARAPRRERDVETQGLGEEAGEVAADAHAQLDVRAVARASVSRGVERGAAVRVGEDRRRSGTYR
mmetsp:Transcript_5481/g.25269  ORF Transcript_5481/g.25269 Transcript_5481/m.25269 type:complete len:201 (-) Transcript_5481:84-686(-)